MSPNIYFTPVYTNFVYIIVIIMIQHFNCIYVKMPSNVHGKSNSQLL